MDEKEKLFPEFQPADKAKWKEKAKKDLKGADFNKTLVWHTSEGIELQPLYSSEDIPDPDFTDNIPGSFPFIRGNDSTEKKWYIRQDFYVGAPAETNKNILNAIEGGVTSVGLFTQGDQGCPYNEAFSDSKKFETLFENVDLEKIPVNFSGTISSAAFVTLLEEIADKRKADKSKIKGTAGYDPLGFLSLKGKFHDNEEMVFKRAKNLIDYSKKTFPGLKIIDVNAAIFHNAGANIIQEMAFGLSAGNEYLHQLTESGLSVDDAAQNIQFSFAAGSDYFPEIAKFRAIRTLWALIVDTYTPASSESSHMFIHCTSSAWNKTIYDPHVNMLRTTTEAMSSIIGGVDSLTLLPFDFCYKKSDHFSERVARNQQIVLKEEASFDKVIDPAAGSYYVENITHKYAEEALKLFKEIEKRGGYIAAFKEGFIQSLIKENVEKKNHEIALRKKVFLGTTQFPNQNEKTGESVEIKKSGITEGGAIYEPLTLYRGASAIEEIRLRTDRSKKVPEVFLMTLGNPTMRKARAGFASNFFACAGFKIIDNQEFSDTETAIQEAIKSKAPIVVICSSDDEYPVLVPEIAQKLKDKSILVIAGYPKEHIETFKKLGINHFIHMKSNLPESLIEFQKLTGIIN